MDKLKALKLRLPEAGNDDLLLALLDEAEAVILNITCRRSLPAALLYTQIRLAIVLYNRMGTEGENSHSEGGISATVEFIPDDIRREIAPYRLIKTR